VRIAIFGTGGAGGGFGASLAKAGEDVAFIARGEHLNAIRQHGLHVEGHDGETVIHPAMAAAEPAEIGEVDAVILGVKTWQVRSSAEAMEPLIGPETIVLPLQNGVDAADQLVQILGPEHVLSGLARVTSYIVSPGRIRQHGAGSITFAELDGSRSERVDRLRTTLENAGIRAPVPDDMQAALWGKFLHAASLGGLGSVCRAPVGVVRRLPETRQLLEAAMQEVWLTAKARGVAIHDDEVSRAMAGIDGMQETATMSLQRDIIAGKPSELEAWSGAVVRYGEAAGVAVPTHSFIYHALLPQELRARSQEHFD